jgi:large subunit ribosomal protein L22
VESTAKLKFLRVSPRKARLVADEVRGKPVGDALSMLQFTIQKHVANDVSKLIKSAVANIQSKQREAAVDAEGLLVKEILVEDGPRMKRFRPRAHGRAGKIIKRMCHISVTVSN